MKTTKVKSVQGSGSFESQYGTEQPDGKKLLFSYDYEFEDGVFLSANHKTVPSPFSVGDTVEYEVTRESEQYGKSGKVSKPDMSVYSKSTMPTDNSLQGVKIGHAITNAVSLYIHERENAKTTECNISSSIKGYAKLILKIGDDLEAEVSKKVTPQPVKPPTEVLNAEPQPPLVDYSDADDIEDNDVPF